MHNHTMSFEPTHISIIQPFRHTYEPSLGKSYTTNIMSKPCPSNFTSVSKTATSNIDQYRGAIRMPCVFNHLATRIHSTFNTRRQCRQRATPMWHAGDDLTLQAPRPRVITGSVFTKQRHNAALKGIPLAGVVFRVEYEGLHIVCIDASDLGWTCSKSECDPVATQSTFWTPEATMPNTHPKTHPRHTQDTPKTHPRHSQDTAKTQPRHTQDTPKAHPRHTQDTPKTHPRHTQDTPKTWVANWLVRASWASFQRF
jgi:hypothetical protein